MELSNVIVHVTIPRRSFVIHRKKLLGRIAYNDKMDSLVNDKQTYEVLKQDPTPALQRKLNNKLLTLKKTDKIDFRRYSRLRCTCSAATLACEQALLFGQAKRVSRERQ